MSQPQHESYTILAPGFAKWWGSDARALAQAFRRLGHNVLDIDEEDYVPWRWQGLAPKVLRRLFSRVWIEDYNQTVLKRAEYSSYDFVLSFKGKLLKAETVRSLREFGKSVFNFYPDVTFEHYGPYIPASLRHYDCVFTTKSYHGEREIRSFQIRDLQHVRHGFDPEVHRPIALSSDLARHYACDVSFVGCWSRENEGRILYLLTHTEGLTIKVFGLGWNHASQEFKRRMGTNLLPGVFGDELAIAYGSAKVNLGLLRRSVSDPAVFDQTTARTFQIPATRSLMLHEDTDEVRSLFKDGEEVLLFRDDQDLTEKLHIAVEEPDLRARISQKGYERCMREPYDYSNAAQRILRYFEKSRQRAIPL